VNNLKNMQYGSEIITYLNNIKSEIELYNGFKLYNINKFAEYFYAEFLNLLFGYELEIMEKVNPNMVAIDLGDKNGKIAIQITSKTDREKIKETVEKFNENNLDAIYDRLVVLHIANETPKYNKPHIIEQFDLKKDVWNIEYLLKQMPIESIAKLKNIRDFLKKYVEDSPQISNLDDFLKKRYKSLNFTKLRPLSSLNRDVYIKDIYQDLSIIKKIKSKDDESNDITISKEITIDKILDDFQKVAILGKSGIGKSTLSKYICYQWANSQLFNNYEYLFYIPIKQWKKEEEGIFDVVLKVLKESINEDIKVNEKDLYHYIKAFNNTTLFVIDGLDEIRKEEQEDITKEIQNFNNYIITSRHEGLNNSKLNIEETFYNEGFNQKSIENFIKYIPNSDELLKQINSNNQLKELSKIPMLLDMICYLYKENQIDFNNHFTMTSLYEKFLDEIIFRFEKEREAQSNKITKEDDDIFFELGKIAFDNLKDKNFKFKGTFITRSNRKFIENELLLFGFIHNLTNERHLKDREYEFIHNSFQEYFSAFYVSKLEPKEKSEKIQESKFHPHMQTFFAFLGGLIGDKKKDIEFLLSEIESEPRDILGYYETLIFSIIFTSLRREKICTTRIENFNNDIQYWIEYIFTDNINFEILERLKNISHFLNKKTGYMLIRLVEKNSIFVLQNPNIIALLTHVGEKNDVIMDILIESLEQEPINFFSKRNMVKVLTSMNRDDEKYNDAMKFIKEHHLDTWNKKKAIKTHSDSPYTPKNSIESVINNTILSSSKDIANFLRSTDKDNKDVIEIIKEIAKVGKKTNCKDIDLNLIWRQGVAKSLSDIEISDDSIINTLLSYVEDEKIEIIIRVEVSKSLVSHINDFNQKKIVDTLINFITERVSREEGWLKKEVVSAVGLIIDKNDKRFIDILKDDNIFLDLKYEVLNSLVSMGNNGEKFENIIIDVIRDKSIADNIKSGMIKPLVSMNRDDKKFIESLIFLIDKSTLPMNKKMLVNYLSKLTDKHNDIIFKKINVEEYSRIFIENSSMKSFCIAFDKKYIKLERVIENAFFNGLPLYLKNKKLHTIENGKEISTQREVDEATLNEIKMLLSKGDDLDD